MEFPLRSAVSTSQAQGGVPAVAKWRQALPVLLTALVIADVVSAIEQSMIYSAFKTIIEDTGDPIGAGWLVSAYYVIAGPAAVVAGRLGDMFGRKTVLLVVLLTVFAGSVISSLSQDLVGIIIGRGLQGVSSATLPLCVAIYRENAPPAKLGLGLGILLSAHSVGTLLGMLIGGAVVDLYHWRSVFVVAAFFALFASIAVQLFTPSSCRRASEGLDWLGLGIAPALICLLFGISSLNSPTLSIAQAVWILVAGALLTGLWVTHELRRQRPIVDLRAFKAPGILQANLIALLTSLGPNHIALYFVLVLQQPSWTGAGFGISAALAGLWVAPSTIVSSAVAPLAGYFSTKIGARKVLFAGALVQTIGWSLALLFRADFWPFVTTMFLCSAGAMITHVGVIGTVTLATAEAHTGEALGAVTVTRSFGGAIGSQLIALLLSLSVITSAQHSGTSFPDQTAHLFTMAAILLCALGTLLVICTFHRREVQPA